MGPTTEFFGDYVLLGEIARGGMGVVFQAVHARLNRSCALKVIRTDRFATESERARFVLEAEAAASLEHPNIVRVRHAGEVGGDFFLEMELVEGGTLAEALASGPWSFRDAARCVAALARAVEHAHGRGVLHRDLKPGNVLLDGEGTPRLTDFGLARWLDRDSDLTRTMTVLGTPSYMAPEALESGGAAVTTVADVYGLGAILYECLTGFPPYGGESALAVLGAVRGGPPPAAGRLRAGLPRDLDILLARSMARDPARRIPSAREFAEELERWLRGEPIRSRAVPAWERALAWARRRPARAAFAVSAIVALVAVYVLTERQRRIARELSAHLLEQLSRSESARANIEFRNQRGNRGLATLARSLRRDPDDTALATHLAVQLTGRAWPRPLALLDTGGSHFRSGVVSTDGELLVGVLADGRLGAWRLADGATEPPRWKRSEGSWRRPSVDEPGRWLLALSDEGGLRVWPWAGGGPVLDWEPAGGRVREALFRPGREVFAVARDGQPLMLVDPANPAVAETLPAETTGARAFAFDSTSRRLAIVDGGPTVRVWALDERRWEKSVEAGRGVEGVSYGDAGQHLVVTTTEGPAIVFRMPEGVEVSRVPVPGAAPVRFNPGGTVVLVRRGGALGYLTAPGWRVRAMPGSLQVPPWGQTFSRDGSRTLLLRAENQLQVFGFRGRAAPGEVGEAIRTSEPATFATFSRDGNRVVISDPHRTAVWALGVAHPAVLARGLGEGILAVGFAARADEVRVVRSGGGVVGTRSDGAPGSVSRALFETSPEVAEFSPNGEDVAAVRAGRIEIRSVDSEGRALLLAESTNAVAALRFAPDGRLLVVLEARGRLRAWDPGSGKEAWPPVDVGSAGGGAIREAGRDLLEFSADGRQVSVAGFGGRVSVVEAGTGRIRASVDVGGEAIRARVLPGGAALAAATETGEAGVWELGPPATRRFAVRHGSRIRDFDVSSDGRRMATGGEDFFTRVWDTKNGKRYGESGTGAVVTRVRFVDRGRVLLSANRIGSLVFLESQTGLPLMRQRLVGWVADSMVASADGKWMAIHARSGRGAVVSIALPDTPAPSWIRDLAESLAGERLLDDGTPEPVPPEAFVRLRDRLATLEGDDYWHRFLRPWFVRNPGLPVSVVPEDEEF